LASALVEADGLPIGVARFCERPVEVRSAHEAAGHEMFAATLHLDQQGGGGEAAGVVVGVRHAGSGVGVLGDEMTTRQWRRGVGASLRMEPEVGKLGGFVEVG